MFNRRISGPWVTGLIKPEWSPCPGEVPDLSAVGIRKVEEGTEHLPIRTRSCLPRYERAVGFDDPDEVQLVVG